MLGNFFFYGHEQKFDVYLMDYLSNTNIFFVKFK